MKDNLIITPEDFKAKLDSILRDSEMDRRLLERWDYNASYTCVWGDKINGIYRKLEKELCLECSNEYCTLDAVYLKEWCKYSKNAEFLSVIMEHENDGKAFHEMNVLLRHNASLKVLVTYPITKTPDDLLCKYAGQIQAADVYDEFSKQQRCLVVFGYYEYDDKPLRWEYHLYANGKFETMK